MLVYESDQRILMNEWMDACTDGWMKEWVNEQKQSNPSMCLAAWMMKRGKLQNVSMEKYKNINNPFLVGQNIVMNKLGKTTVHPYQFNLTLNTDNILKVANQKMILLIPPHLGHYATFVLTASQTTSALCHELSSFQMYPGQFSTFQVTLAGRIERTASISPSWLHELDIFQI